MIRRLAVGGMGEIFLARQQIAGVHRLVVLKRLLPDLAEDPQLLAMFVDEARIAANLAHPGIVQVHEFGEDAQGHFIVMEYVPGHHVGQIIVRAVRESQPIPVRLGAYIVHEVVRALDHAHHARDSAGAPLEIVHRDISPSNVLVSFRGDVKLMDFGVARAANRAHRTSDGTVRGKFAYMAPEQIEGKHVDARTDVYAAGVLLWEITLGRRLFTGSSDLETIRAALEQPIPRPSSIDPTYPPDLEALVMSALERLHERRLASAAAMATGLKTYLRANPVDRDDLITFMSTLFPDDAAESARLEEQATKRVEAATVMLSPAPESRREPRRRARWLLLLVLVGMCGGGALTVATLWPATREPVVARAVATDAAIDRAPDAPVDAAVDAPADVPTDAPVDAPIDAPHKPPTGSPPEHSKPPDAAPAVPDAPPELGAIAFSLVGDGPVFLVDAGCTTKSVPARCKDLVVGSSHTYKFTAPGVGDFSTTVRVGHGLTKCDVVPATKQVRCR